MNRRKFKVEKATSVNEIRYVVAVNGIPIPEIALWLDWESIRSPLTGRTYAYAICSFLNYLGKHKLNFINDVSRKTLEEYFKYLVYGVSPLIQIQSSIPFNSLKKHQTAIKNLYCWLESERAIEVNPAKKLHSSTNYSQNYNKTKLLYGQIHDFNIEDTILSKAFYKAPKQYIKWYSNEEIRLIVTGFKQLRDKIIFLISIETGMRIGEICGLKMGDFDRYHHSLSVERSFNIANNAYAKTTNRTNYISRNLSDAISQYISRSRKLVLSSEFLFVNHKGVYTGNPISPTNYSAILKRVAASVGMNPDLIRTHNGRSTRAQQLVELMRDKPESGVTLTFILEELGWASERSASPYIKNYTLKQKKKILERLQEQFQITDERWYD